MRNVRQELRSDVDVARPAPKTQGVSPSEHLARQTQALLEVMVGNTGRNYHIPIGCQPGASAVNDTSSTPATDGASLRHRITTETSDLYRPSKQYVDQICLQDGVW